MLGISCSGHIFHRSVHLSFWKEPQTGLLKPPGASGVARSAAENQLPSPARQLGLRLFLSSYTWYITSAVSPSLFWINRHTSLRNWWWLSSDLNYYIVKKDGAERCSFCSNHLWVSVQWGILKAQWHWSWLVMSFYWCVRIKWLLLFTQQHGGTQEQEQHVC